MLVDKQKLQSLFYSKDNISQSSNTLKELVNIHAWNVAVLFCGRMFANGPGDLGSIPGRVIPKTLKMVLDTSLLKNQQYKVCIKGKVEQSRERSSALSYTSL